MSPYGPPPDCPDPWNKDHHNWIKIILVGLTLAFLFYIFDTIFYGIAAKELMSRPFMKATPDLLHLVIGYVLAGILYAVAYSTWWCPRYREMHLLKKGSLFGVLLSLVVFLPGVFIYHALFEDWSLKIGLIDQAYHIFQFAVFGIVVAYLYQWKIKKD